MLNEQIIPAQFRSDLRRTLSLLDDSDYQLDDYKNIVDEMVISADISKVKQAKKAFRTTHLCLNIIYFWCQREDNLSPAIVAANISLLGVWESIRVNNFFNKSSLLEIFFNIYQTCCHIYVEYAMKIQPHCYTKNGLLGTSSRFYILECLSLYKQIGIMSLTGIMSIYHLSLAEEDEQKKYHADSAFHVADTLKNMIENHQAANAPLYDDHSIEIIIACQFLLSLNSHQFVDTWIRRIVRHIAFSYVHLEKYFPVDTDSFDDLVAVTHLDQNIKEKLVKMSTLLPSLAYLCIVLDQEETYRYIKNTIDEVFPKCTLQIWYPDEETDEYLYKTNAAYESGASDSPIFLSDDFDEMKNKLDQVQKYTISINDISSLKYNTSFLPYIASLHFRTPVLPLLWQGKLVDGD